MQRVYEMLDRRIDMAMGRVAIWCTARCLVIWRANKDLEKTMSLLTVIAAIDPLDVKISR